jgi:hypothetical protein
MAVSLMFHDFIDETTLSIHVKDDRFLSLYTESEESGTCIYLDKLTAIKLSKELRKLIALLD